MSEEQILEDTLYSGIHPARRYMFWQKAVSAMPLNFPYMQPKLRENSLPIHYLDLFCTKEFFEGLPAKFLLSHIKAFCSISVLKGQNANNDPEFNAMEKWLSSKKIVPFLDKNSEEIRKIIELKKSVCI